eukprot:5087188-Heterocapsa_arctica.AAC.1
MGMPHHHAWQALLSWAQAEKLSAAESKLMKDYCEYIKKDPMQVRHVRICRCYNKDMIKLECVTQMGSRSYHAWQ